MKKQIQKSVCVLAVLAATSLPAMAESVDVHVIGSITPAACTPSLSGGGTMDYGVIAPASLKADDYTVLAEKQLNLTITCTSPAKVAIQAVNGRPNSIAGANPDTATEGSSVPMKLLNISTGAFGLGLDGAKKVGGYALVLDPTTLLVDGNAVDVLDSTTTSGWSKTTRAALIAGTAQFVTWATPGQTTPVAFETLTGTLHGQAYLNKASELDLTKPVPLDGLTTLEMVYL